MSRLHRFDYLLTALPGLDAWGSTPPVSKQDFLGHVIEAKGPLQTVQTLLLMDDLVQREALLAEEITTDQADLAVLRLGQDEKGPALPDALLPTDGEMPDNPRLAVDGLWARYFRFAAQTGQRSSSRFLQAWVGFEVTLRNALSSARAQALNLDPLAYVLTPELEDKDLDFSALLSAWSAAPTPLMGLGILDKARWDWLEEHGQWYSFKADEVEAYAAKLCLLHRWRRLAAA